MAGFTSDVKHLAGANNKVADALSRPPKQQTVTAEASVTAPESQLPVDLSDNSACQRAYPSMLQAIKSPSLQVVEYEVEVASLWCNQSTSRSIPLLPKTDRQPVLITIHKLACLGTRTTRHLNKQGQVHMEGHEFGCGQLVLEIASAAIEPK
jgi:hypothetical protein